MPGRGDLCFPGWAVAVALLLGPVLMLLAQRRWSLAAVRREEVRRLAALASKEAERAEMEASVFYYGSSLGVDGGEEIRRPRCAVCFSLTTTRCSRCKAVRYCSGKCQIIHWRQGHKDECHPAKPDNDDSGQINSTSVNAKQAKQSDLSYSSGAEGRLDAKSVEAFLERPASPESVYSSEISNKDDNLEDMAKTSGVESTSDSFTLSSSSSPSLSSLSSSSPSSSCSTPFHFARPGENSVSDTIHDSAKDAVGIDQIKIDPSPPSKFVGVSCLANHISCLNDFKQNVPSFESEKVEVSVPCGSSSIGLVTKLLENIAGCHNASESSDVVDDYSVSPQPSCARLDGGSPLQVSSKLCGQVSNFCRTCTNDFSYKAAEENTSQVGDKAILGVKKFSCPMDRSMEKSEGSISFSSVDGLSLSDAYPKVEKLPTVPSKSSVIKAPVLNVDSDLKASTRKVVQQRRSFKISRHYSSGFGIDISPMQNYKMLFPYDLFIKLYNSNTLDMRPFGLINCGNSCYANSVLQCLAFTRPLNAYLLEGLHAKTCAKADWCFMCEFENILQKAKQGKSPLSPVGILSHVHNIGSNLCYGREEDAHEFLRFVIDALQSVCLKQAGMNAVGRLAEETTLIQLIFGGYLRSKIRCMRCHGKSEQHERMMDLTVEIHGDIRSLEEALARFTATEVLDGENKYRCNRCNSYEQARKKLTVSEAPNVLTITLKRFQSGKCGKLNKAVRFPEYLNLAPYMSGTDDKSPVYRLYAVVVHIDIMNAAFSGHYICYAKTKQGKWYKIDDSKVISVELDHVLSENAYMLLYARCSLRAPSLLRKLVSYDHNNPKRSKSILQSRSQQYQTSDAPAYFEPFDLFDERFSRSRAYSSSDSSSMLSGSDECSWTTESTRDSTSTEEYSDYILREQATTI